MFNTELDRECDTCAGTGRVQLTRNKKSAVPCAACKGHGRICTDAGEVLLDFVLRWLEVPDYPEVSTLKIQRRKGFISPQVT